jgi:hypothetical protein
MIQSYYEQNIRKYHKRLRIVDNVAQKVYALFFHPCTSTSTMFIVYTTKSVPPSQPYPIPSINEVHISVSYS